MIRKVFSVFTFVLFISATIQAQNPKPRYSVFGGTPDERACVRVEFMDNEKKVLQQFAIDYGTPVWKKEYEDAAKFDAMTKGKVWRFGSNFWTRLDTNLPLKIAGKSVPIGIWYLGLRRSQDGAQWSMVFIHPAKARSASMDAFFINEAPIEMEVPLTFDKATEIKEKLTVMLTPQKDSVKNLTLRISWGQLQLRAPVEVSLEG